jgi:hypothetical protein
MNNIFLWLIEHDPIVPDSFEPVVNAAKNDPRWTYLLIGLVVGLIVAMLLTRNPSRGRGRL